MKPLSRCTIYPLCLVVSLWLLVGSSGNALGGPDPKTWPDAAALESMATVEQYDLLPGTETTRATASFTKEEVQRAKDIAFARLKAEGIDGYAPSLRLMDAKQPDKIIVIHVGLFKDMNTVLENGELLGRTYHIQNGKLIRVIKRYPDGRAMATRIEFTDEEIEKAAAVAAAVTLAGFPRPLTAADDAVFFANDMDVGIKGVFCAGIEDAGRLVFGPIGAKSSGLVPRNAFPPRAECERLYVHMEDGAGWQFWSPHYEEYYADVLIQGGKLFWSDSSGTPYVRMTYSGKSGEQHIGLPPGLLIQTLVKYIRLGMRESDWELIAVPGLSPERRGEYALTTAGDLWSLTDKGITYQEISSGQHVAVRAEFVFSEKEFYPAGRDSSAFSFLMDTLVYMRGYVPWLFSWNGNAVAFTEEGKKLMPNAALLSGEPPRGEAEQWEAFAAHLAAVFAVDRAGIWVPESALEWFEHYFGLWEAIGGKIAAIPPGTMDSGLMIFGDEYTRLELELPIGTQKAVLRIIRNDGAAFVGGG